MSGGQSVFRWRCSRIRWINIKHLSHSQGNVYPPLVTLLAPGVFHLENTKSFKGDSLQFMKPHRDECRGWLEAGDTP